MYISLIATFLLILGITVFALQNDTIVAIKFFIWEYNYTQVAVILGSALVGAAIMAIMTWPYMIKKHFRARRLARQVREFEKKHQDLESRPMPQGETGPLQADHQGKYTEASSLSPRTDAPS